MVWCKGEKALEEGDRGCLVCLELILKHLKSFLQLFFFLFFFKAFAALVPVGTMYIHVCVHSSLT